MELASLPPKLTLKEIANAGPESEAVYDEVLFEKETAVSESSRKERRPTLGMTPYITSVITSVNLFGSMYLAHFSRPQLPQLCSGNRGAFILGPSGLMGSSGAYVWI